MSSRRRSSNFQGAKQQALGSKGPQVAPAWKTQAVQQRQAGTPPTSEPRAGYKLLAPETGSKILVSYLPQDVTERDLWDLFKAMVGPLKDLFIVYSAQGESKGSAVIHFHRAEDGVRARNMYNGKIIDGERPIRIELVTEPKHESKSLLTRLRLDPAKRQPPKQVNGGGPSQAFSNRFTQSAKSAPNPPPPRRRRKKGPKRVQKSLAQLDEEMDEYRAQADADEPAV